MLCPRALCPRARSSPRDVPNLVWSIVSSGVVFVASSAKIDPRRCEDSELEPQSLPPIRRKTNFEGQIPATEQSTTQWLSQKWFSDLRPKNLAKNGDSFASLAPTGGQRQVSKPFLPDTIYELPLPPYVCKFLIGIRAEVRILVISMWAPMFAIKAIF